MDSYLNISPFRLCSVGMLSSIFYSQVYTAQCIDKLELNLVSFTTGADSRNLLANGRAGQLPLFPPPKNVTVHRGRRSRAAEISTCPHACFEARSRLPVPPGFHFQYQLLQKCRAPWESHPTTAISPRPTCVPGAAASLWQGSHAVGVPSTLNFPGLQGHGCDWLWNHKELGAR